MSIFAEESEKYGTYLIGDSFEGLFLSESLIYSGMEVQNVDDEYLRLSISKTDSSVAFECEAERGGIYSNKIRLVIDVPSSCGVLDVELEYVQNGEKKTVYEELETERSSGKKIYYIDFEYARLMTKISISFPRMTTGEVKLYSVSREYVYEDETEYIYKENANVSVSFDPSAYTVSVSGTVGHGTVTKYSGAQIELHRLSIEQNVSSVFTDESSMIDSKPISIQFRFDVKISDLTEAYSQYVLVINSVDGEKAILSSPCVPSNDVKKMSQNSDEDDFKGVSSDVTVDAIDVNPSLVVFDVFLDRLENINGNGYYFAVDNKYYYFDREYINELDNKIKAYTDTNCKIYLRFVFGSTADYGNVSSEFFAKVYAYSYYLAQRYNGGDYGAFAGIIAGENADRFSAYVNSDIEAYLKFYSMYLYILSESAHLVNPEIRIFVPISDIADTVGYDTEGYASESFLMSLSEMMETLYSAPPSLAVMLCGAQTPLENASQKSEDEVMPIDDHAPYRYYTAEKIADFEAMLTFVSDRSELLSGDYVYLWSPKSELSGSMLTAAYAYNYLKLYFESSAESFVVSLNSATKISDLKHIVKYIDTPRFSDAVEPSLEIIGAESWGDLISKFDQTSVEKFRLSEIAPIDLSGVNVKGSYDIWKFSELNGIGGWYSINGCNSMSIKISSDFGRCLVAKIQPYNEISGQYSSIICSFGEEKDISFADYITYTLGIACESDAAEVFEVKFVIGSQDEIIESTQILKAGSMNDITLDIKGLSSVSYMQINIKAVSNQEIPYNLYINKISEHSERYTDAELKKLEEKHDEDETYNNNIFSDVPITSTAIISLCVVLTIVAVAFVLIFKKVDRINKK